MKNAFVTILLTAIVLSSFSILAVGQTTNDKAAKEIEKVRKAVAKAGTGTKSKVEVDLIDGKVYSGYISEANDKSFVVIDKQNVSNTINYSDVRKVYDKNGSTRAKYITIGVAAGAATVIFLFFHAVLKPY
jgi:hypothetical protein